MSSKEYQASRTIKFFVIASVLAIALGFVISSWVVNERGVLQKAFRVAFQYSHSPKLNEQENFEDMDNNINNGMYGEFYKSPIAKLQSSLTCDEIQSAFIDVSTDGKITSDEFKSRLMNPIIECYESTHGQPII